MSNKPKIGPKMSKSFEKITKKTYEEPKKTKGFAKKLQKLLKMVLNGKKRPGDW